MRQKFRLPFILTTLGLCKKGEAQKYINDSIFFLTQSYLHCLPSLGDCVAVCHWEDGDCRRKPSQASFRASGHAALLLAMPQWPHVTVAG